MKIKYSFEAHLWILLIVGITLIILSATGVIATQTIFDNVNITKNLTVMGLNTASCDVKTYTNGTLYCGTDSDGGANISTTTCSGTQKVSAVNNATGAVTCSADVDTSNTSAEIWAVIDNSTFHKFSQTITWGNLSNWNLNSAWTGSLGWGNLTGYNLNSVWTGTLGGGNITTGTIGSTQITDGTIATADMAAAFAISLGNVTNPTNCTAGNLVQGKAGSAWVCTADLFNSSAQMDTAINATANRYFQLKVNESVYLNSKASTYYLNTGGGITFSNITDIANCSAGQYVNGRVGNAWVCAADVSGGGSGANYWQTDGAAWMWPNLTAGGYNSINVTTVNATNFYQAGDAVLDVGTAFGGDVSGTYGAIDVVNTNGLDWGNISAGWDLNEAWTNSLGWGNISGRTLSIAWTGSLGAGNITSGTITATQLASTFAINLGNVTDVANCTAAQKVTGKVAGAWVCGTDLFNTTEEMQDAAGALLGGTETLISVTYDDVNGDIDFVVDNDLHKYSWANVVDADITNTLTASILVSVADQDIGAWEMRALTFESDQATGTAPFTIASTTQVANLNVSYSGTAYDLTCTDCIGGTEIAELADADINNAITIAGAVWVNSTTGMNTTKIYAPLICGDQACTHNMTYNGTQWIIYG